MKKIIWCFLLLSLQYSCNAQQSKLVSAKDFQKGLSKPNTQILDVRTIEEYNNGHIKNSLQANWNNTEEFKTRTAFIDKEKPLFIYCQAGGRSAAANAWLQSNGFKNVIELKGGMLSWQKEKLPIESVTTPKQITKIEFDNMISDGKIYLVDFGATWCAPCLKMKPIIDDIVKEYSKKFTLIKIDARVQTNLINELKIETLPTIIIYKNNKVIIRSEGVTTKENLVKWMFENN